MLMRNICESLKIHPFIQECANNIYATLPNNKNTFNLFCHLRFGDKHKDAAFINRSNNIILKNINEYINGHITNLIKPTVYCMIDNNILAISNVMFRDKKDWSKVTDEQKEQFFFIFNNSINSIFRIF